MGFFDSFGKKEAMVETSSGKFFASEFISDLYMTVVKNHLSAASVFMHDFFENANNPSPFPKENPAPFLMAAYMDSMGKSLNIDFFVKEVFTFHYFLVYKYFFSKMDTIDSGSYSLIKENFSKKVREEISRMDIDYYGLHGRANGYFTTFSEEIYEVDKDDEDGSIQKTPCLLAEDESTPEFYKEILSYCNPDESHWTSNEAIPIVRKYVNFPLSLDNEIKEGIVIYFTHNLHTLGCLPEEFVCQDEKATAAGFDVSMYGKHNSNLFRSLFNLIEKQTYNNLHKFEDLKGNWKLHH